MIDQQTFTALLSAADLIGEVTNPHINQGDPVPLFRPKDKPPHLSINTLEGWNAATDQQNRRSFRVAFDREPADDADLNNWVRSLTA